MQKRIKMKCWNCKREFSLLRHLNVDEQPRLLVECPFCENQAVVDLAPYRSERTEVYKSGEAATAAAGLDLPDILPTMPPED